MKIIETHIVPAISEKIRLQEYGVSIFDSVPSRSSLKKAIKKSLILLDGKPAATGDWIKQGQKIELLRAPSRKKTFKLRLEVLYQDEFLAVVNKPSGIPTSGNYFKTLENALPYNLKESKETDTLDHPLPAHRLDSPTSGLLICAKTRKTLIQLQRDFSEKKVRKIYHALVKGCIDERLEISEPIDGKAAQTEIIPQDHYKISEDNYTLLKLIPLTGRTHQIRIHLANNANPIVGDREYGKTEQGFFKGRSLFLFSTGIEFIHPVKNEKICLRLSLPKKLRNLDKYRCH